MGGCRHGIRRQHHLTDFVDDPPLGFHEAIAFRHGCLWSCGCGRGFRDFGQAPILPDGGGTGGVAGLGGNPSPSGEDKLALPSLGAKIGSQQAGGIDGIEIGNFCGVGIEFPFDDQFSLGVDEAVWRLKQN